LYTATLLTACAALSKPFAADSALSAAALKVDAKSATNAKLKTSKIFS
jgi:hypothetical protein